VFIINTAQEIEQKTTISGSLFPGENCSASGRLISRFYTRNKNLRQLYSKEINLIMYVSPALSIQLGLVRGQKTHLR